MKVTRSKPSTRAIASGVHKGMSQKGVKLLDKIEALRANMKKGSLSLSFGEVGKRAFTGSLVGVKAVDKLEHGVDGGRPMKVYLMVRVLGRGMKMTGSGARTQRVPARGIKPIVARSLADIEKLMKDGPKAFAAKHSRTGAA
jgi:hypothetical protein